MPYLDSLPGRVSLGMLSEAGSERQRGERKTSYSRAALWVSSLVIIKKTYIYYVKQWSDFHITFHLKSWFIINWKAVLCGLLTIGCNWAPGSMNCICWANMAAAAFCWIRLFLPLISSWVFRCGGGWRYLQLSRVQRPYGGERTVENSEDLHNKWQRVLFRGPVCRI